MAQWVFKCVNAKIRVRNVIEEVIVVKIQLLRHATLIITINEKKILVDPMLSPQGVMPPIQNSPNPQQNPLVEIPIRIDLQKDIDGVLLTHIHRDHLDEVAIKTLPLDKPILCQPEDESKLKEAGFLNLYPIHDELCWEEIMIKRTGAEHGMGEIAIQMAPVSGYVLKREGEPSLYIAGDSIYCEEVSRVLAMNQPKIIVLNAGGARFNVGDPITMTAEDVIKVCHEAPNAKVIAVHMDAINHCIESRADLRTRLKKEGLLKQVLIPMDGEVIKLSSV